MGGSATARPSSDWNERSALRRHLAKQKMTSQMQKSPELISETGSLDMDDGGSVRTHNSDCPVFHFTISIKKKIESGSIWPRRNLLLFSF